MIKNLKANKELVESLLKREDLSFDIKSDVYKKALIEGIIQGPKTNYPSRDKEWLKNYSYDEIISYKAPNKTITEYVESNNRGHEDEVALSYFNRNFTYNDLQNLTNRFQTSFQANGIGENDSVVLLMVSTPEVIAAQHALINIGAKAVMLHPLKSENEIKSIIDKTQAKMMITIDATSEKLNSIKQCKSLNKTVVVPAGNSMSVIKKFVYNHSKKSPDVHYDEKIIPVSKFLKEGKNLTPKRTTYDPNRTAIIMETGGTSGKSKLVELTNDNFNSMVEQFKYNTKKFERGDSMLDVMPPFHGFGLCSSIHLPLSFGAKVILIPKVNVKNIHKTISKYKVNHILAVPTFFKGLVANVNKLKEEGKLKKFDTSSFKYLVSGGSTTKDEFEKSVDQFSKENGSNAKLCKGYGLSEAVAGVTFADESMKSPNTIGIPMIKTNIKICDLETGEELQNEEVGEICINGPTVMKGYYNEKQETKQAIDEDGWLHTGDLGYCKDGEFFFSERKGNMIISSGVNVYPNKIERVIEEHKAVSACAVIGVYHPYKEEVPKAYIALKNGYAESEYLNEEIMELCKKNLDKYSIPSSIQYCEELPQTLLGKINHKKLKEEEKAKTKVKK